MNKGWILLLITLCHAGFDPFDKYSEDGPILTSLTKYVEQKLDELKEAFDKKYSIIFNWEFCSMAAFPMLLGKRCPYFPDSKKYRAIHWRGSTAYIPDENHVYVGIKYSFYKKNDSPSDTITYQVISYKLINPYTYSWIREKNIITLPTILNTISQTIGKEFDF
jgi:hypothetical protein